MIAALVGQPQILSVFPPLILSMQDYTKWWEPNEGKWTCPLFLRVGLPCIPESMSHSLGSENALMLTGNVIEFIGPFIHHGNNITYIIHQVPLCGRYLLEKEERKEKERFRRRREQMGEEERDREIERIEEEEEKTNGKRRGKRKGDEERIHRRRREE